MSLKKVADRWAFLDEFEAPMWADLTLDAELSNKEQDDEWFHRSHKFHRLPSRKLKAAFKDVDGGGKFEIDFEGSSSPKLPSSVSKSRGKHYVLGTAFQLSMIEKGCLIENGDGEASQLKRRNEVLHKSALGDLKSRLHPDQENTSGNADFKLSNTSTVPNKNDSSSVNTSEINVATDDPKNSVTSESSQMPGPQVVDASNRIIGRSELLSVMKQSLHKSCAIRMAKRGQLIDGRQTNGYKSSSGKSSVGSCSVQSRDTKDLNVVGVQRTSRTPESRIVERLSQESRTRDEVKASMDGGTKITNTASDSGGRSEPLKSEAKAANRCPRRVINRDITTNSVSFTSNSTNRASECGNRGKVGMAKVFKTATKSTQLVINRAHGSISKVSEAATANNILERKHSVSGLGASDEMCRINHVRNDQLCQSIRSNQTRSIDLVFWFSDPV
uniref:Uncharacterized protein n=1 Tax=Kalanchoe fedtschenkoi TaxID=63787 RepID=A0A7N0RDR3_KALFE